MLRLKIDGAWEPQDFIEVLQAVESMYYKLSDRSLLRLRGRSLYLDDMYRFGRLQVSQYSFVEELDLINQSLLARARYEAPPDERLRVRRIQYASAGGLDLLGVGKVCEVIANSIGRMKVYYDDRHLRRERDEQTSLETEHKRIELEKERESLRALKIQNVKEALKLLDENPDDHEMLVPLLVRDQDALSERIAERMLISAETSTEDEPERR